MFLFCFIFYQIKKILGAINNAIVMNKNASKI